MDQLKSGEIVKKNADGSESGFSCKTKKRNREPFFLTAALVLLVMIAGGFFVSLLKMVVFVIQHWYIVLGTVLLLIVLKKTIFADRDHTLPCREDDDSALPVQEDGQRPEKRSVLPLSDDWFWYLVYAIVFLFVFVVGLASQIDSLSSFRLNFGF